MDQSLSQTDDPSLSFSMLEMVVLEDSISYTSMCGNKRFILDISVENLEGEGDLVDAFYQFKEDLDDHDTFIDFEGWAVDAIDEQLRRLVEIPSSDSDSPTSLQDHYAAEIFVFTLVNRGGVLAGLESEYDPGHHGGPGPKITVVELDARTGTSLPHSKKSKGIKAPI